MQTKKEQISSRTRDPLSPHIDIYTELLPETSTETEVETSSSGYNCNGIPLKNKTKQMKTKQNFFLLAFTFSLKLILMKGTWNPNFELQKTYRMIPVMQFLFCSVISTSLCSKGCKETQSALDKSPSDLDSTPCHVTHLTAVK